MFRTCVSSSNLASVGYDASERILEIEFLNGSIYHYYNVPSALYHGLMSAGSHGGYLNQFIKKAGYRYRRIR